MDSCAPQLMRCRPSRLPLDRMLRPLFLARPLARPLRLPPCPLHLLPCPFWLPPRRALFQNARLPKSPFKEETSSEAHEYSIGPEVFAFKVVDLTVALNSPSSGARAKYAARRVDPGAGKEAGRSAEERPEKSEERSEERPEKLEDRPEGRPEKFEDRPDERPEKSPEAKWPWKRFNVIDYVYRNATNYPFLQQTPQQVFDQYPKTNSARLARHKTRPRKTKMLVSDFIEDSLYNPHYGYFSKEVEIFHNEKPFDYSNIEDTDQFMLAWEAAYLRYDRHPGPADSAVPPTATSQRPADSRLVPNPVHLPARATPTPATPVPLHARGAVPSSQSHKASKTPPKKPKMARYAQQILSQDHAAVPFPKNRKSTQLWHTPTELFLPHYGEALARYILVNYKLNHYPYQDLVIYEMGGGNGTLMCNILNHIQKHEPDIYARTQYKIIEISSQLALKQYSQALQRKLVTNGLDSTKLQIINKSIFKWDTTVDSHCYFIALEVFDNFAHDLVRYDNATGIPHEGHVLVDGKGDFYQFFTPQLSHYTNALLRMREHGHYPVLPRLDTLHGQWQRLKSIIPFVTNKDAIHPLLHSSTKLHWANKLNPLKDNLSRGEFIPTRLLHFFQVLKHRFPNHSLISSDFHSLPNTMPGYYNAPVVQTVIQDRMVDVSTYMCHQGYFDIMFPTDFNLASDLYRLSTNKHPKVELHREFLEQWADIDAIATRKGEHPMLDFYKNVSFMTS